MEIAGIVERVADVAVFEAVHNGDDARRAPRLVVVDLQNSTTALSLEDAIASLGWAEPARQEVFFAAFK